MENKLEEMFKSYLSEDCICVGEHSSYDDLMYYMYIHFGISNQTIEDEFCSVYKSEDRYYIPKLDFKKVFELVGV